MTATQDDDSFWAHQQELEHQQWEEEVKATDMIPSRFLKQTDITEPHGRLVTISEIQLLNVAPDGAEPEKKYAMFFQAMEKPLVLNSTNIHALRAALGEDTDPWVGKQIVLYVDPNIHYGGKVVGGLRLRAPRPRPGAPAPAPLPEPDLNDDIPF